MESDNKYILVLSTCPDPDIARQIAQDLVVNNLAACVNILPGVYSCFTWKDKVEYENECLLFIKSRENLYPGIEKNILAAHPYELPEIIVVPINTGLQGYLNWIDRSTK